MARLPNIDNLSSADLFVLQREISQRLSPTNPLDKLPQKFREELHSLYEDAVRQEDEYFDIKAPVSAKVEFTVDAVTLEVDAQVEYYDPISWDIKEIEKAVSASSAVKKAIKNKEVDIKRLRNKIKEACKILDIKSESEILKLL